MIARPAGSAKGGVLFDLIKELTELAGPVGQEGAVLDRVAALWREAGATIERTGVGSVLARAGGDGPSLLLVAHADELCYLVRAVDPGGFLWLANGVASHRFLKGFGVHAAVGGVGAQGRGESVQSLSLGLGTDVRLTDGLETKVGDGATVILLPAVAGGR